MSTLEYIRKHYGVPARRGQRVVYRQKDLEKAGVITSGSSSGAYINIRFDGEKKPTGPFHPTDGIEYVQGGDA